MIHRDLKSDNVLVSESAIGHASANENSLHVKVADFGHSRLVPKMRRMSIAPARSSAWVKDAMSMTMTRGVGTPLW